VKITRRFTRPEQDVFDTVEWMLCTTNSPPLEGGGQGVGGALDSMRSAESFNSAKLAPSSSAIDSSSVSTHPPTPSLQGRGSFVALQFHARAQAEVRS